MRKLASHVRWVLPGAVLLAMSGCITNQQLFDFTRTEFARVIADTLGQAVRVFIQATA